MSDIELVGLTELLIDARERSRDRRIWAEHEAAEVVGRLKGRSVDDTRAVIEAAGFEWRGSRPRTLTAIHDELFAGWRAFNRCLA